MNLPSSVRALLCLAALPSFAAAPRGLEFNSPADAVTQIDSRLGDWFKNKGDRKAVLATRAEVEARLKPVTTDAKELKKFTNEAMAGQKSAKPPKSFTAVKALIDPLQRTGPQEGSLELFFLEAQGNQACAVQLKALPDGHWVLYAGPTCMQAPVEQLLKDPNKLQFEKQGTTWAEVAR